MKITNELQLDSGWIEITTDQFDHHNNYILVYERSIQNVDCLISDDGYTLGEAHKFDIRLCEVDSIVFKGYLFRSTIRNNHTLGSFCCMENRTATIEWLVSKMSEVFEMIKKKEKRI